MVVIAIIVCVCVDRLRYTRTNTVYLDNFELENNKAYDAKQQSISLHPKEAYTAENKGLTWNEVEEYEIPVFKNTSYSTATAAHTHPTESEVHGPMYMYDGEHIYDDNIVSPQ